MEQNQGRILQMSNIVQNTQPLQNDQKTIELKDLHVKVVKLETENKKLQTKVFLNQLSIKKNQQHLEEMKYKDTVMITFECVTTGCKQTGTCYQYNSPKNEEEIKTAIVAINKDIRDIAPYVTCSKIEPKTIKVFLTAESKDDLEYGIEYINANKEEYVINERALLSIEEFGGIFNVGAVMNYLAYEETDETEIKKHIQEKLDKIQLIQEDNVSKGMQVEKVTKGNQRVLYYMKATVKKNLDAGLENMTSNPFVINTEQEMNAPSESMNMPKHSYNVRIVDVKNPHWMEKFATKKGATGYLSYIFPFWFYCRFPIMAISLLPLSIQVTWLKCVLVNIYTIIRTAFNMDKQHYKCDFQFIYMLMLGGFVYVARDHEEIFLKGVGDLAGENGEYKVAHIGFIEQFISGSAVFLQYVLDYKDTFQQAATIPGEVRKMNVIVAILQVIYAGLFISNDYAWFVCSFLPFIFLTKLPMNPVPLYAHLGAITSASFFIKGKLEIMDTFLTYPRSLIINVSSLVLYGCAVRINQQEGHWKKLWIEPIRKNGLTILKSICIILHVLVPDFDLKLWFTAHYILLATPNLLKKKVQRYLMGLLIMIETVYIYLSESPLSESALTMQSLIGDVISLGACFVQYAKQEFESKNELYVELPDVDMTAIIDDKKKKDIITKGILNTLNLENDATNFKLKLKKINSGTKFKIEFVNDLLTVGDDQENKEQTFKEKLVRDLTANWETYTDEDLKSIRREQTPAEMTACEAYSKEWKDLVLKKSNQIVSLFTATSIPNPALMVLSMIVPTFFCMQQWSVSVISGPIFVPILYTVILIWSYGFKDTSISDSGVPDYVWNIVSACVAVSMSINTIPSTDHYYELIGKKIKKYFDDNDDNERGQILLAYITMALMFVFLLVSQ